ncbi:hypothetical protein COCON_G00056400 [Conger conger]|uniref:Ig-like domain-containing protein n=1 Tax=Conger conger TaxID=82655 RepID=A0A9Q1DWL2_CONCO|nr:hypothetical protein COCON_G00056400 [Conger conger]
MEDILWRWNTNKVVEFNRKGLHDYGKFQGRTILDVTTGALTLTHLRESDSGEYVDAVDKPTVTCQVNRTSVTLLCSGDDRPATQYRWEGPAIEPQPGPQLKIEAAETSDSVYTCVLNNPVSESRTELPVKSCFPAPGGVEHRVKPHGDMMRPAQAHDEHQKAALAEQHRGADGRAALSQEESQTGSEEDARTQIQGRSKKEKETAGANQRQRGSQRKQRPFSSQKIGQDEEEMERMSGKKQEGRDEEETAGANQTAGSQRQREERMGQDGGKDRDSPVGQKMDPNSNSPGAQVRQNT